MTETVSGGTRHLATFKMGLMLALILLVRGAGWADAAELELPKNSNGTYTLLANINDDDGDGVPDYADLNNSMERNIRRLDIPIGIYHRHVPDNQATSDVYIEPERLFIGIIGSAVCNTSADDYAGRPAGARGYRDFRAARSNGTLRVWMKDPRLSRNPNDVLCLQDDVAWLKSEERMSTSLEYPSYYNNSLDTRVLIDPSMLGLSSATGGVLTLWVEGLNSGSATILVQAFGRFRNCVEGGGDLSAVFTDKWAPIWQDGAFEATINVVEVDLGINCNENMDDADGLRVGVPDVTWKIDDDDEAIEDQKNGMPFWYDMVAQIDPRSLINMMPLIVRDDQKLHEAGYEFYLRSRYGATFLAMPKARWRGKGSDLLDYLKSDAIAQAQLQVADQQVAIGSIPVKIPVNFDYNSFLIRSLERGPQIIDLLVTPPGGWEFIPVDSVKVDFCNYRTLISMMSARDTGTSPCAYPVEDGRTFAMERLNAAERIDGTRDGIDLARKNYHVFVHGYANDLEKAIKSAAQVYKSMYWTGFRGNFIGFAWPGDAGPGTEDFNIPVQNAMRSAPALVDLLETTIQNTYGANANRITMFSHSLGNMVAFDALRLWQYQHPGQKAVRALTAIEAAISESMFWPVADYAVRYFPNFFIGEHPKTFTVDNLKRVSRAFWANQPGHEAIQSAGTLVNSWNNKDYALNLFFAANDMARRVLYGNPIDVGLASNAWPAAYRIPYCKDNCSAGTVDFVFHSSPLPIPGSKVRSSPYTNTNGLGGMAFMLSYDNEIAQGRKPMPSSGAYAAAVNVKALDYGWHPRSHSGFVGGDSGYGTGTENIALGSIWRWYEQVYRSSGYPIGEE